LKIKYSPTRKSIIVNPKRTPESILPHGSLGFKDIEVVNQASGKPIVRMIGRGKKLFEKLNLKSIHISISHDRHYAIAHAIAEQ